MASNELTAAEAEWRLQFSAMQAALANLHLPVPSQTDEVSSDDDDWEGCLSGNDGQEDVWDFISGRDADDYSCESVEAETAGEDVPPRGDISDWFLDKSAVIAFENGLAPDVFQSQVINLLASGRSDDELQAELTDLIGPS